ncbi:YcaO-like family protein [Paractinoplanes ferrugineus]|uniref:YcaO domain-containing protein n=1 Tax=Paractinoplanes ferrugineus TaxID=113564 RepID=A0A919J9W7_9ACTN|nr:YcaO-like family protein [Actinoplanes ferrugineus]GIE13281.1 hypothetical protein Afe05nite_51210 [Actinoplanes ferrugineus]
MTFAGTIGPARGVLDGGPRETGADEAFWQRIQPVLNRVGVTRVADITWLDDMGIPACQAIRPDARTLSVSQGKGATVLLAAISAAMEAIEVWHAENLGPAPHIARVREVSAGLGYPLAALRTTARSPLNPGSVLGWSPATRLLDGVGTLVPTDLLRLDSTVAPEWAPVLFECTSNGLASGATRDQAVLHGLLETVERDALTRLGGERGCAVDPAALGTTVATLADRFRRADVAVRIEAIDTPVRVACFAVRIRSDDFPAEFHGTAAGFDAPATALQAMMEAAQARVAAVAGTREDLSAELYHRGAAAAPMSWPEPATTQPPGPRIDAPPDRGAAIAQLTREINALTGFSPLVVDHTRPEFGIPVVRVVCPGLHCPNGY